MTAILDFRLKQKHNICKSTTQKEHSSLFAVKWFYENENNSNKISHFNQCKIGISDQQQQKIERNQLKINAQFGFNQIYSFWENISFSHMVLLKLCLEMKVANENNFCKGLSNDISCTIWVWSNFGFWEKKILHFFHMVPC